MHAPNFMWGNLDGETFCHIIDSANAEATSWRHSLFPVPTGKVRSYFVMAMASLFRYYGEDSAVESNALRAAVMPILVL